MKAIKISAFILVLIILTPFLMAEYLYRNSLDELNLEFSKPTKAYSNEARVILWSASGEKGEIGLERTSASGYLINFISLAIFGDPREYSDAFGSGYLTASHSARLLMPREPMKNTEFQLKSISTMIWLTQNVGVHDLLDYKLENSYYGYRTNGLESAAQLYFGKNSEELAKRELLWLILLLKAPSRYNPYCNPTRFNERYQFLAAKFSQEWQNELKSLPKFKESVEFTCK